MSDQEYPLYEDVKAMDVVSGDIVRYEPPSGPVQAVERGTRHHPSGVTESYERLEF
jgi:hypothetical protein